MSSCVIALLFMALLCVIIALTNTSRPRPKQSRFNAWSAHTERPRCINRESVSYKDILSMFVRRCVRGCVRITLLVLVALLVAVLLPLVFNLCVTAWTSRALF